MYLQKRYMIVFMILACSIIGTQGTCSAGKYFNTSKSECKNCPKGTYKNSTGGEFTACMICPQTNGGYNRTTLYSGSRNIDDCYSKPIVEGFEPSYGPVSGGTQVQIKLNHWETHMITYIYLGAGRCHIITQSVENGTVTCTTGSVTYVHSSIAMVTFNSDTMIKSTSEFEYKVDPVVYGVDEFKTIISGGLLIKVFGDNFTSVVHIYFQVIRIHKGDVKIFYEPCKIMTSKLLHCVTPNVGQGMIHHLFTRSADNSKVSFRRKRSSSPPTFNDKDNEFYAGLVMDGMKMYQNFSEDLSDYGQLLVYPDPVFYPFDEPDRVRMFNPKENEFIDILGKHINYAATKEDITVTVGLSKCNVTLLATNQLTCRPQTEKPTLGDTWFGSERSPTVTVFVGGNLIYVIGYLNYNTDTINEVVLRATISCGIFLLFLFIFIIIVLIRCRKKREGFKDINANVATNEIVTNRIKKKRYVDSPVLSVTVATNPVIEQGSVNNAFKDYGETIPTHRGREMSCTISPPATPGDCSVTSDSNSQPSYFNYNNDSPDQADVLDELDENLMLDVKECLLEDTLDLQQVIGNGYFGTVHKGTVKITPDTELIVAVKTIQGNHFTTKEVGAFLGEAVLMKEFSHKNVLSLIGCVLRSNRPFVVLPLMEHGDLKSYIKDPAKRIKVRDLLGYGLQVACGMSYLARQKFVHRDLATRNCMLNNDMEVKIADFGLSRDVYKCDYYRIEDKHRALPVRWMAVESLTSGVFSSKSDVWSFGVTLWELLTRGCSPYPDVDTFNIKAYVTSGRRLSQPDHAPDEVFSVMSRCWTEDPEERPTFDELYNEIDDILSADTNSHKPDYAKLVLPV